MNGILEQTLRLNIINFIIKKRGVLEIEYFLIWHVHIWINNFMLI